MMKDKPELIFASRADFREWLQGNAANGAGVWLVFSKTKDFLTVSANDALEEALCFGWIDGQMRSIDETRYIKYFAPRRKKSNWSAKNKKLIGQLKERGLMTELGDKAVASAISDGSWDAAPDRTITDEQVAAFAELLVGLEPAAANFAGMSPSMQRSYTGRYLSFRSEEGRQRDFARIIERLNNNLKPM